MIKAVRGTRDLLPPDTALWNFVESAARDVFRAYNFQEIRTPIFEETQLFSRSVGEETDIVSKEMFTWDDGERFNEKRIVDEWLKVNQADDPNHEQAGRVNVQGTPEFRAKLKELGIQFQVWRGNLGGGGHVEFVAFRPKVSPDIVDALMNARDLAKSLYAQEFAHHAIELRLVVPDEAARTSPWVKTKDVVVEPFAGNYFSSSQSLTLRPENTAGVVRAYIEHNLERRGLNKLFYIGPQFRRERPQRGRYRQFYQIGAEVIGPPSSGSRRPIRDAELIDMLAAFLNRIGLQNWTLELNSVGCASDRAVFNEALRKALAPVVARMCSDCQRRAVMNPLRVFDCKVADDQAIIDTLPKISEFLDPECKRHFDDVKALLRAANVEFKENHRLVRGLDYYSRTAFEFTYPGLGAQNAILGGGRYDGLSESLGGPEAPGIGFAIGEDRLIQALEMGAPPLTKGPDVYIAPIGEGMNRRALQLARELRNAGLLVELGDRSFKMGRLLEIASKVGARYALIVGENEAREERYGLKNLATGQQVSVPRQDLVQRLQSGG